MYILGKNVSDFEKAFAHYCGAEFSVGTDNGTTALILPLKDLKLKEDDEVITAPNSFIASASSVALSGGKPVFCDVGEDLNMDPAALSAAITPRTRAVMPVHLAGRPCKMDEIMKIAKKHDLFVLEDAAQAVGAKYNNKKVGSFGDASAFSLHPMKNLHAFGDGGMLTTNSRDLCERMMQARNHGLKNRNECDYWSLNCRLDEIQAAMLCVQIKHLDEQNEKRRTLAFRYNGLLEKFADVPKEGPSEYCVYQTYVVQVEKRDLLLKFLNDRGVEARIHYPIGIHLQPAAKYLNYTADDFPMAKKAASRIMSLPLYPTLTYEQQDYVKSLFEEFYAS
jgi:dTDP-4-amino-4,6-dideoxygalactose transaminase